jgi:hypothetical protein
VGGVIVSARVHPQVRSIGSATDWCKGMAGGDGMIEQGLGVLLQRMEPSTIILDCGE